MTRDTGKRCVRYRPLCTTTVRYWDAVDGRLALVNSSGGVSPPLASTCPAGRASRATSRWSSSTAGRPMSIRYRSVRARSQITCLRFQTSSRVHVSTRTNCTHGGSLVRVGIGPSTALTETLCVVGRAPDLSTEQTPDQQYSTFFFDLSPALAGLCRGPPAGASIRESPADAISGNVTDAIS